MPALLPILAGAALTLATSYSLGWVCLHGLPAPRTAALAAGSAVLSVVIFLLLLFGIAGRLSFGVVAAAAIAMGFRARRVPLPDAPKARLDRLSAIALAMVAAPFGALYLVHTLSPGLQADAINYHLGLPAEYLRLGGRFSPRIGFHEMLPQGMEMLFLFAYAFGRESAAKLVHLAFLIASVPLLVGIGRRLHLPDLASFTAAALYCCAPVVGVTGTAAMNDAAMVFFGLATVYLLLVWRQQDNTRYLLTAGNMRGLLLRHQNSRAASYRRARWCCCWPSAGSRELASWPAPPWQWPRRG